MSAMKITRDNFEKEVLQSDKPVLLDFWAPWCGPCQMVGPVIDSIAEEVTHAKVGKVNVDEQQELAQQFGIMSIPALVVMDKGKVVQNTVGARPKETILAMLDA
ncbi:thioredoxin [Christensenellaceae bacterium OttesenSCG-928-M15]|nr:thioredoxin [Christensenellaceae bacterium OttesenSCG-928-M15]